MSLNEKKSYCHIMLSWNFFLYQTVWWRNKWMNEGMKELYLLREASLPCTYFDYSSILTLKSFFVISVAKYPGGKAKSGWLTTWLTSWLTDNIGRQAGRQADWLIKQPSGQQESPLTYSLTHSTNQPPRECPHLVLISRRYCLSEFKG